MLLRTLLPLLLAFNVSSLGPSNSAMRVIDGRLIWADEAKIIFAADDHQECTLEVAANATVTRDGQEALLKNLRMGDELQVTTQTHRGKPMAVVVAARTAY